MKRFARAKRAPVGVVVAFVLTLTLGCAGPDTADSESWRLSSSMNCYSQAVASIAFSPDGSQIASSHSFLSPSDERPSRVFCSGYLKCWDADYLSINRVSILIDGLSLQSVCFDAEGKRILVPSDGKIFAWDIEKSQLVESSSNWAYPLSANARLAVRMESEDKDDCLLVEDLERKEIRNRICLPERHLHALVFSPDNRFLAMRDYMDDKNEFIIWNLETNRQECAIRNSAYPRGVSPPIFAPDGETLVCASNDNVVRIWNTIDGSMKKAIDFKTRPLWSLAISPNGRYLAIGYEAGDSEEVGGVVVWDLSTYEQLADIPETSAWGTTALAFSPNGELLAVGNSDGEINLRLVPAE